MPYSTFQVKIGATWTTPPDAAMPASIGSDVIDNAPIVRYYEAETRDGYGRPVIVSSEMYAIIGRTSINTTGMAWWYTTVGLGSNVSTVVNITLFDPITQTWLAYSGYAWRPTYDRGKAGNKVTNFMIKVTNLVAL